MHFPNLSRTASPKYTRILPQESPILTYVEGSTSPLRPFVVTAVLRNIRMTQEVYESMIDLQEKLHFNLCRKRTLVAIGVHDLDSLQPPFRYSTKDPREIRFQPLNQPREFQADELMDYYKNDTHLKPYLHIIKVRHTSKVKF
jgi:phenylalanyl-tRNA synthetase beta chain